jgi:hypothetical protein
MLWPMLHRFFVVLGPIVGLIAIPLTGPQPMSAWIPYVCYFAACLLLAYVFIPRSHVQPWKDLANRFRNLEERDRIKPEPGTPYNPRALPTAAVQDNGAWRMADGIIQDEVRLACLAAGKSLLQLPRKQRLTILGTTDKAAPIDTWLMWTARTNAHLDSVSELVSTTSAGTTRHYVISRVAEASVLAATTCADLLGTNRPTASSS